MDREELVMFNSKYKWIDNNDDLAAACSELVEQDLLGIDCETAFWKMGKHYEKLAVLQIAFFIDKKGVKEASYVFLVDTMKPGLKLSMLKPILENPNVIKTIHNASFDCEKLSHHLGIKMVNVWCTMRAEKRVNKKISASLATLAERHFGLKLDKEERESQWEIRPLIKQQQGYAAKDAVMTLWLYLHQKEKNLNGRYEHFESFQPGLPLQGEVVADADSLIRERHIWLQDWIANGGPANYPDKDFWLDGGPPYYVHDIKLFASNLEQKIADLSHKQLLDALLPVEGCGCGFVLGPEYWEKLLESLYQRIVNGECSEQCERLEEMRREMKREARELTRIAEFQDQCERADIEALAAIAESENPERPDYSAVFGYAGAINRYDLVRKYKRAKHGSRREYKTMIAANWLPKEFIDEW